MIETIRVGPLELRFRIAKEESGGALDVFEMIVPPTGRMPVPHYHRDWEETVYGLEGVTTWTIDGVSRAIGPGDSLLIRRGQVHGFDNHGTTPSKCLCILTPGVLGPGYFRALAAEIDKGTPPDPAAMRDIMLRHGLVPVIA